MVQFRPCFSYLGVFPPNTKPGPKKLGFSVLGIRACLLASALADQLNTPRKALMDWGFPVGLKSSWFFSLLRRRFRCRRRGTISSSEPLARHYP